MKQFLKIWSVVCIVAVYFSYYSGTIHAETLPNDTAMILSESKIYPTDADIQTAKSTGFSKVKGYGTPTHLFPPTNQREVVTLLYENSYSVVFKEPETRFDLGLLVLMLLTISAGVASGFDTKQSGIIRPAAVGAVVGLLVSLLITYAHGAVLGVICAGIAGLLLKDFFKSLPSLLVCIYIGIMGSAFVGAGAPFEVIIELIIFSLLVGGVELWVSLMVKKGGLFRTA